MMSSYYRCQLFDKNIENYTDFSFIQEELLLKNSNGNTNTFEKIKVEYKCSFHERDTSDWNKPTGIIPIKDNIELLEYTLNNLREHNVYKYINFIIVDDRSTIDLKTICSDYPVSYLRVDNEKGFNFSALNNIAAKIAYDKNCKKIILWNSDLWVPDEITIPKLLQLHDKYNATISGTKLLYPPFSWNNKESESIKEFFNNKKETYRDTVQFGGSFHTFNDQLKTFFPNHFGRFSNKDNPYVSDNKIQDFVTGAFQIINLEWYINDGGLNQSMSKNFQDVDICFRCCEQNKKVMYFGNIFLYHDESVSLAGKKSDNQMVSDHILYSKIWDRSRFFKSIYKMG